ncbi:hypothetical protein EV401DRAFT_1892685 [Pisolithus croceorrhizus]|nr:hypothetical protein EV401DRAFT_1892685 [Pisolithus croceorrhizus]
MAFLSPNIDEPNDHEMIGVTHKKGRTQGLVAQRPQPHTVLIHQQCFLVSLPVAAVPSEACLSSMPCNENGSLSVLHNSSSGEGASKDCAPMLVHLDNEHPQLNIVIRRDITRESEDCSPGPVQVPPQHETKLCGVNSTIG